MEKTLLSFGHGYVARTLAQALLPQGWRVFGTTRNERKINTLRDEGAAPIRWPDGDFGDALAQATHILISAAPGPEGDPILAVLQNEISALAPRLEWAGYLSTTGVYGDHDGAWVDETTPLTPATDRGKARVAAEAQWQSIPGLPLQVFRLAGIYGPGRGPFEKVKAGTARRIIKENQVFSRIHVEDIAQVLEASMARPNPGAVYNVCDDDPAPPQDVIAHAAHLLDLPMPPAVAFEDAEMSPMARSFYSESKRVSNNRIKQELGANLIFPSYRDGLPTLLE